MSTQMDLANKLIYAAINNTDTTDQERDALAAAVKSMALKLDRVLEYTQGSVEIEQIVNSSETGRRSMRTALENAFSEQGDEFWGVEFNDFGESSFSDTGYGGCQCTGFAAATKDMLAPLPVVTWGYYEKDNPTSAIGQLSTGHDFAVLDGRYIIDAWVLEVENGNISTHDGSVVDVGGRTVWDMEDPADTDMIATLYGDISTWERTDV